MASTGKDNPECMLPACYWPYAIGSSWDGIRAMIEEDSSRLISGIDCAVCGESSITILEWDRPLRSGRPNPLSKIVWVTVADRAVLLELFPVVRCQACLQCLNDVLTMLVQRSGDGPLRSDALCGVFQLVEQNHRSPVHVQYLHRRGQHDDAGTGRSLVPDSQQLAPSSCDDVVHEKARCCRGMG